MKSGNSCSCSSLPIFENSSINTAITTCMRTIETMIMKETKNTEVPNAERPPSVWISHTTSVQPWSVENWNIVKRTMPKVPKRSEITPSSLIVKNETVIVLYITTTMKVSTKAFDIPGIDAYSVTTIFWSDRMHLINLSTRKALNSLRFTSPPTTRTWLRRRTTPQEGNH